MDWTWGYDANDKCFKSPTFYISKNHLLIFKKFLCYLLCSSCLLLPFFVICFDRKLDFLHVCLPIICTFVVHQVKLLYVCTWTHFRQKITSKKYYASSPSQRGTWVVKGGGILGPMRKQPHIQGGSQLDCGGHTCTSNVS
jgi:hypothetical protein